MILYLLNKEYFLNFLIVSYIQSLLKLKYKFAPIQHIKNKLVLAKWK